MSEQGDIADRAAQREETHRTAALAAHRARSFLHNAPESAFECRRCATSIPQARRDALPGVQLCVHCQAKQEQQNRWQK